MNPAIHELAKAVLKKPLQDCSIEELLHLTQQYPYFGPAQLLLAKKLSVEKDQNLSLYEEQVQKTSLYFPNRVWLEYLLRDSGNNKDVMDYTTRTSEEKVTHPEQQHQHAETVAGSSAEPALIEEPVKEELTGSQETISPTVSSPDIPVIDQPVNTSTISESSPQTHNEDIAGISPAAAEILPVMPEAGTVNEGLIFEPYHTVDYFASQGIKFKEEEKPKDRFSVQLKSFTEWLKTLKKATPGEIVPAGDATSDKKVEQMAEFSLAERHVITEAMAEVWKKQGNKAKAEEIYRKLSLLDPSKSSYFAAKIDELKKTS